MPSVPDHYSLLGIARDATQSEIKKAYFEAAQRLHPDKNAGQTEHFLLVQKAYETLSNTRERARYDTTLPPEPKSPILVDIQFSRSSLLQLNEPQVIYVLLELARDKNIKKTAAPPLNVCLVLDRSTSMQDKKLDMVKATASQLLRELAPKDIFSLVTFSDRAEVVLPAQYGHDTAKAESRIQVIQSSGGTEILRGLQAGLAEVRRHLDPTHINHIIVLTDGHTYGDEQACSKLAMEAANDGIGISALGIGLDWNDDFLDMLAKQTGGGSFYVSKPEDIKTLLAEKFQHLSRIYAEDVVLEFSIEKNVNLSYVFRLQPEVSPLALETPIQLGDVLDDMPLRFLLEFTINPIKKLSEGIVLLDGRIKFNIAGSGSPVSGIPIRLTRSVTTTVDSQPTPARLIQSLSRLSLYRMQEKARLAMDVGDTEKAAKQLKHLATRLLSQGENSLAKTVLLETEHIQKARGFSEEGSKQIKYGTRALMLTSVIEEQ